ncbi:hypothetical protein CMV30_09915 [Nibricoccus aquaticus]|uniref:DUF1328 domain-containing protein n=2 Tax=Nibricoccus aquaticus TaxID=2576891 RepID=A0A290Q6E5_9BACT|nr:hypothetical protein CMV30_09915 [Nibricoccus aquaticus]
MWIGRNIRVQSETMLNQNLSLFCAMLNWVITLLLLATVAGFFVFAGTGSEIGSLLARIAVAGCSAVAAVMLGVHLWHRTRHTKAG